MSNKARMNHINHLSLMSQCKVTRLIRENIAIHFKSLSIKIEYNSYGPRTKQQSAISKHLTAFDVDTKELKYTLVVVYGKAFLYEQNFMDVNTSKQKKNYAIPYVVQMRFNLKTFSQIFGRVSSIEFRRIFRRFSWRKVKLYKIRHHLSR